MPEKHAGSIPEVKISTPHLSPEEENQLQALVNNFVKESSNLEDYADVYDQAEIADDQAQVVELRTEFAKKTGAQERNNKFYSQVLEMVVRDFGNTWLPGYFSKASEYDDYLNGTDLVWELENEAGTVQRIAIDVTSGNTEFRNKIEKIKSTLSTTGRFQTVKYFTSELEGLTGEVILPKIIIGIDRQKLTRLARLYLQLVKARGDLREKIFKNIAAFDLGQDLVNETMEQLTDWENIIEKNIATSIERTDSYTEEEKEKNRARIGRLLEMTKQLKDTKVAILAGIKKEGPRAGEEAKPEGN